MNKWRPIERRLTCDRSIVELTVDVCSLNKTEEMLVKYGSVSQEINWQAAEDLYVMNNAARHVREQIVFFQRLNKIRWFSNFLIFRFMLKKND